MASASVTTYVRLSTFRRGFVSTLSFDLLARGLAAIAVILLVRALSVDDYAFVILFLAVSGFIGTATTGGVRMWHLRTEAEAVSRGLSQPSSFVTALVTGTLIVVVVGAVGLAVASVANINGSPGAWRVFVLLAAGFAAGDAASELVIIHHQAHLAFTRAGLIGVLRSSLLLLVALAASLSLVESGEAVAAAFAIAMLVVAVAVAWPRFVQTRRAGARTERGFGLGVESRWLTLYYLAAAGFAQIDIFVIAAILDEIDVASFGLAQRFNAIALGAFPALVAVMRVRTAQWDLVDSLAAQREMFRTWVKRVAPIAAAGAVVAAVAAPFVIPIVDEGRYPDTIPVFQILLFATFASYVMMPAASLLMAQRRFRTLALIWGLALVANTVGDLIVGPLLGVVGVAALATSVYVALFLGLSYAALHGKSDQRERRPAESVP